MSYTCHIHRYSEAAKQCPNCHQSICAACEQHGAMFDGKWLCPSCMNACCHQVTEWKSEKTRNIIFLAVALSLVVLALLLAVFQDNYWMPTFLCGLAGLPLLAKVKGLGGVFKGLGKGNTVEDMAANSCLVIFIGVGVIFAFGVIMAPVNIIMLAVSIAGLSKKIAAAEPWTATLTPYLAEAGIENQKGDIVARQQAAERAREEQRQQQELIAAQRQAEEDRRREQRERAAMASARSAPKPELYALTLKDPGPYRQDVIEELAKHTGRRLPTLESGMELATNLSKEKADELAKALAAFGARVEQPRRVQSNLY